MGLRKDLDGKSKQALQRRKQHHEGRDEKDERAARI